MTRQILLGIPTKIQFSSLLKLFKNPFIFLLFCFFFTTSGDLLNVRILVFNFKLNNLLALFSSVVFFVLYGRSIFVGKTFFIVSVCCLFSLIVSAVFGYNKFACVGFILFFVFNYLFYFLYPVNLFRVLSEKTVFDLYFLSFIVVGGYAMAQVLFSCFGIILPYVGQFILTLARGQGFSYEPSYYALYMTPYTMFWNAKFLLQKSEQRNGWQLFWANFFLLISTSTGCFFSYIFFILSIGFLKLKGMFASISLGRIFFRFCFLAAGLTIVLSAINPNLVRAGFLKFFYQGFTTHYSFMERWTMIVKYLNIFWDNLWIGTGLGGATTYLLLQDGVESIDFLDPNVLRSSELIATNISAEVLASLGILGACFFGSLCFLIWKALRGALKIKHLSDEERINLQALILSLVVTFGTLQFSQSIMRAYIWVHVGICVGYAKYLHRKYCAYQRIRTHEGSVSVSSKSSLRSKF